jgi:LacI family transcriptional regulator
VAYLVAQGHRRIAYVSAPLNLVFANYRLAGYREALSRAGLPYDESLVVIGGLTNIDGYEAGREFLQRANPPTAIIAGNDLMALGVMSAAQELGLRVGRDVSMYPSPVSMIFPWRSWRTLH